MSELRFGGDTTAKVSDAIVYLVMFSRVFILVLAWTSDEALVEAIAVIFDWNHFFLLFYSISSFQKCAMFGTKHTSGEDFHMASP